MNRARRWKSLRQLNRRSFVQDRLVKTHGLQCDERGYLYLCCTCCGKITQRAPVLPVYLYVYQNQPIFLNEPYYGNSASIKLLTPTRIVGNYKGGHIVARRNMAGGAALSKAGSCWAIFFSSGVAQLNLFDDNAPRHNSDKLMAVLDTLNAEKGKGTLYFAGQGIQQPWAMKRDMLSPRYTTRYSDLLRVG